MIAVSVPFGLGIGRLGKFGKQSVDFRRQPFWYAENPKNGPDESLQFQVKRFSRSDGRNNLGIQLNLYYSPQRRWGKCVTSVYRRIALTG